MGALMTSKLLSHKSRAIVDLHRHGGAVYGCALCKLFSELVRPPINHSFSWALCAPIQITAIAVELPTFPWGRLPVYIHTICWKYCRPTVNAMGGEGMLEQDLSVSITCHDFHNLNSSISAFWWCLTSYRWIHLLDYELVFLHQDVNRIYFIKYKLLEKDLYFSHSAASMSCIMSLNLKWCRNNAAKCPKYLSVIV